MEPETAGDLDPDRAVWTAHHKRAHLTRSCPRITGRIHEKPAGVIYPDTKLCKDCTGAAEEPPGNTGGASLAEILAEMGPEEAGLGERQ